MSSTINPQDLRIGNLIKIDGIICRVDARTIFDFEHDGRSKEPIPLTEEILVKCGFIKSYDTNWQYQLGVGGIKMYCRYNTEWYFELGGIYMGSRPKYLNELQNIFHSLTGRELEIKL